LKGVHFLFSSVKCKVSFYTLRFIVTNFVIIMIMNLVALVLRRIFGPKRDEATGEWRKLHNEELHNLYSSPDIIRPTKSRKMRVGGACGTHGRGEKTVQDFGGKARRKETTRKTE
jgi:hypothetical protein